jgi:hypothetical protein
VRPQDRVLRGLRTFVDSISDSTIQCSSKQSARSFSQAFAESDVAARDAVVADATKHQASYRNSMEKESAEYYIKTMDRIAQRGLDYPTRERARIKGMLSGKLSPEKKQLFQRRRNILKAFQGTRRKTAAAPTLYRCVDNACVERPQGVSLADCQASCGDVSG